MQSPNAWASPGGASPDCSDPAGKHGGAPARAVGPKGGRAAGRSPGGRTLAADMPLEGEGHPCQEDEPEQEERLVQQMHPLGLVLQVVELENLRSRACTDVST